VLNEDFLTLDPNEFKDVEYILCDPTCTGSGDLNSPNTLFVGKKESGDKIVVPESLNDKPEEKARYIRKQKKKLKKKKKLEERRVRQAKNKKWRKNVIKKALEEAGPQIEKSNVKEEEKEQQERIKKLSNFQVRILSHALSFPNVKRVVYSTCSIHTEENEQVVKGALGQSVGDWELCEIFPEWKRRGREDILENGKKTIRIDPLEDRTTGFFIACLERKKNKKRKRRNNEEGEKQESPSKKQKKEK